jgi:hypothetical protein
MAIIPNGEQFRGVSADEDTRERGSKLFNSQRTIYTMDDITSTVILNGGGGGLAGSGTTRFIPKWISPTTLGDSDIERTLSYSAPNGGQYELRGNLKIFGEASGSGVAALFVEDSVSAQIQIRDVDNATSAINSELAIVASDNFVSLGTTVSSPVGKIIISLKGNGKFSFDTYTDSAGTDIACFVPTSNLGMGLGAPTASGAWRRIFTNLDEYADDAAAIAGGIVSGELYQTDGTGAAPLNVAGIVMVAQ